MAIPKPKTKRLLETNSQPSTTASSKKRNAEMPATPSAPANKRRKTQAQQEQEVSDDTALQNSIASTADHEGPRRSTRTRATPSTATTRAQPNLSSVTPQAESSKRAAARSKAAKDADVDYEDGNDENEQQDEEPATQFRTPKPRLPAHVAHLEGTPHAPLSAATPKNMTDAEIKRVTGTFKEEEIMAMQQVVDDFGEEHNMQPADVHELVQFTGAKPSALVISIRDRLVEVCDKKYPRQKVYNKMKKLFHNFKGRGTWTEEEDDELKDLVDEHGPKWKFIGDMIQRHEMDVRDRYRTLTKRKRLNRKDKWDDKEENDFQNIVYRAQELIQQLRDETTVRISRPLEEDLPWELISEMLGKRRTVVQCRKKWAMLHPEGTQEPTPYSPVKTPAAKSAAKSAAKPATAPKGKATTKASASKKSRQASVELGRKQPQRAAKSKELVEEHDDSLSEDEDEEMGGVDEQEDEDADEEEADEDIEVADSQPPVVNRMEDDFEDLPTVKEPSKAEADSSEEEEQEEATENIEMAADEDEEAADEDEEAVDEEAADEEEEYEDEDEEGEPPFVKQERPDKPARYGRATTISETPAPQSTSSSEERSDEDSDNDGKTKSQRDVKTEAYAASARKASDESTASSSGDSHADSTSSEGSSSSGDSNDDGDSNGDNKSGRSSEERSSSEEAEPPQLFSSLSGKASAALKSASQPLFGSMSNGKDSDHTQSKSKKASTVSPTPSLRDAPAASAPTLTNGKTVNGSSKKTPKANGKAAAQRGSNSKTAAQRAEESEDSSDSDMEDIPNKVPPATVAAAAAARAAPQKKSKGFWSWGR